jgi:hypothetical protein
MPVPPREYSPRLMVLPGKWPSGCRTFASSCWPRWRVLRRVAKESRCRTNRQHTDLLRTSDIISASGRRARGNCFPPAGAPVPALKVPKLQFRRRLALYSSTLWDRIHIRSEPIAGCQKRTYGVDTVRIGCGYGQGPERAGVGPPAKSDDMAWQVPGRRKLARAASTDAETGCLGASIYSPMATQAFSADGRQFHCLQPAPGLTSIGRLHKPEAAE